MVLLRKTHNKQSTNLPQKNIILRYGHYGIKSCDFNQLTSKKVNWLKRFMEKQFRSSSTSKKVKIWVKVPLNLTLTKLSSESRMGKGKGNAYENFSYIKPGQILFEIGKIDNPNLSNLFSKICKQINFKVQITKRNY